MTRGTYVSADNKCSRLYLNQGKSGSWTSQLRAPHQLRSLNKHFTHHLGMHGGHLGDEKNEKKKGKLRIFEEEHLSLSRLAHMASQIV